MSEKKLPEDPCEKQKKEEAEAQFVKNARVRGDVAKTEEEREPSQEFVEDPQNPDKPRRVGYSIVGD